MASEEEVNARQLESLDDTDCYATAWEEALKKCSSNNSNVRWGGRGKGGRGMSRRTYQPKDIVVDNLRLEYVGNSDVGSSKLLLDDATLKILSSSSGELSRVYALIGRNGSGKTTLLKRMDAGKIPGFPPHVSTLHIPQQAATNDDNSSITPMQHILERCASHTKTSKLTNRSEIKLLEEEIDKLNVESNEDQIRIEELGIQISELEDEEEELEQDTNDRIRLDAEAALTFMGIRETLWDNVDVPLSKLSPGYKKKVALAVALTCRCDLLLLDEPTDHLDVPGLIQLRQLIKLVCNPSRATTVVIVSHDMDLINDVATDIIELDTSQLKLYTYPGCNYNDYLTYKRQNDLHTLRQAVTLEKKRATMVQTLENLKKQTVPKRGGAKKKAKQIESQKKKIEREGLNVDEKGHKWKQQKAATGMKPGSINAVVDSSTRRGLSTQKLLKMTEKSVRPPPDKAVQFVFRNPASQWGEPLIVLQGVGHAYNDDSSVSSALVEPPSGDIPIEFLPKSRFLFDCVDMCIDEGKHYCILGKNGCGKSVLLRILAKLEVPLEGTVRHALNVNIGYLDQKVVDDVVTTKHVVSRNYSNNCISYLSSRYPQKTEHDIRAELTSFGLSPKQATTDLRFLSGGERRRLCLASLMLGDPQVLILDLPTRDLDMESVEALTYGINRWKGTVVMVTHDANFVRSLNDPQCYVLLDGRLRRVDGGIDTYLRSFA